MAVSETPQFVYVVTALVAFLVFAKWSRSRQPDLSHIPSMTSRLPILSFFGALKFAFRSEKMLQEGYHKYKGGAFRVPEIFFWRVLVTSKTLVDELRKANDNELSFREAVKDTFHSQHTLGREPSENRYHTSVVRIALNRNLGVIYPDIRDELVTACQDLIPFTDHWVNVNAYETVMKIVCRTTNRIFVGLPLCRNTEFLQLNMDFTIEVVKGGHLASLFPEFLRGFVVKHLTSLERMKALGEKLLGPMIAERLRTFGGHDGDWPGKPNDAVSWLIDAAPPGSKNVPSIMMRILIFNFVAIHTSTMAFTQTLYHVAASPGYQAELREEVEAVVKEEGWTKDALRRMTKVDSFIKEVTRFNGMSAVALTRKAMKDFTFSNGLYIPKGTILSATAMALQYDEKNYENPEVFDPWRFSRMERDLDDLDSLRNQFVNTHPEFLTFGLGRHACPGRFFASTELKSLLANIVLMYDVKMEKEGVAPKPTWIVTNIMPSRTTQVLFRRRQT